MNPNQLPPSLDTWTTCFLLAAGQGIFLAILLFLHKTGNRRANLLLGFFILAFAVTLIDYVGFWTRYGQYFPSVQGIYAPLTFVFGPLLLMYFRTVAGVQWQSSNWLHFSPVLIFVALKFFHWQFWFPSVQAFGAFIASVFLLHLTGYGIWAGIFCWKNQAKNSIQRRWQWTLLGLYGGFVLGFLIYYVLIRTPFFTIYHDYSIAFTMTVLIYAVGFLGYRQPEIFAGQALLKVFQPKYQNSSLTPAAANSLRDMLLLFMEKEQPHLDNDLRLGALAQRLNVSIHHLSQVINEQFGKNFTGFINEHRVASAKKMLANPAFAELSVMDIAFQAGFNNKTSFNKIFKEATGVSPSKFRSLHSEKLPTSISNPTEHNHQSRPGL